MRNSARYEPSCPVTPVINATLTIYLSRVPYRPPRLVARYDTMRVAVKVLGGELVQFGVLQRFHLVHQSQRDVHALAGGEFKLLEHFGVGRFLDANLEPARAQEERLVLNLVK